MILEDSYKLFDKIDEGVDGVLGVWTKSDALYKDYGGQSNNLQQFWKAMSENGGNVEKAAFETFTGNWAKENGFTKVEYLEKNITEDLVIIKFIK